MSDPASLIADELYGLDRCPQCGIARPLLRKIDKAFKHHVSSDRYDPQEYWYFTARCSHCDHHTLFYGSRVATQGPPNGEPNLLTIVRSFPSAEKAAAELPEMTLRFFQQALESKHAPDGAVMLAASAIDSMLKDKGYADGSLYARIGQATTAGLLTSEMQAWAHEIRLSANDPRHADEMYTGASAEDAEQILAFTKALGEYLYVLPARVKRWQAKLTDPD